MSPQSDKKPIAKVFVDTDRQSGRAWTISASHELLEMLVDPGMNLTVLRPTDEMATTGQLYAYEVCDPCDADEYVIQIHEKRIQVSNFVYPAWFEWFQKSQVTQGSIIINLRIWSHFSCGLVALSMCLTSHMASGGIRSMGMRQKKK